ncbi:uncharacterized protein LOC106074452 isoform X2 [Biomphalaria glabrata]|uniref:Uncharacterized protein LOC106074452 isoform X2 n=1 Tax=Biomphalaria glabrata TaxID=6526 RepID=A0A9W2YES6_BIOGL|nr:uncharacterized protein LOC106074452 isoform X2 [Biomphalaria glabrata]
MAGVLNARDDAVGAGIKHNLLEVQSLDAEDSGLRSTSEAQAEPASTDQTILTSETTNNTSDSGKSNTLDLFTSTSDLSNSNSSKSTRTLSASSDSAMDKKTKRKESSLPEAPKTRPKIVSFFKRKLRRGKSTNAVEEISINPQDDNNWAAKNFDQPRSGSSSRSSSGGTGHNTESSNLMVVCDMDAEYDPEHR